MANGTGGTSGDHAMLRLVLPVLFACPMAWVAPAAHAAQRDPAYIASAADPLASELAERAGSDLKPFYAARGWRPLWLSANGMPRQALLALADQIDQAPIDGLRPSRLKARTLRKALERAESGKLEDLARLELTASRAYAGWVRALRGADRAPMFYETDALAPVVPSGEAALLAAAAARSLDAYVAGMGWMHPLYRPLRAALLDPARPDDERRLIAANLLRVRALPANPGERYVLVDAAGARLWMYDKGKVVDSMKVVVGKADNQTPMMAGFIRYAILNPYWNVPDDLVAQRIAPNVLDKGMGYLAASGYQVLSDWTDKPAVVDPARVDWRAVADGIQHVRVRQLPGGDNFMGKVKFEFPNAQGIYLHDTPQKNLMLQDARQASSGCVRLEDAPRLGRWLMGKALPRKVAGPEKRVPLPELVPVYITYLTAYPDKSGIAFRNDPYGRDGRPQHFAAADFTTTRAR